MKQHEKKGIKNQIGAWGEQIAVNYLTHKGFSIVETNFLQKWGEIDIVARETDRMHFVEVKTVSYETRAKLEWAISHETWRPEENVHLKKLKRMALTIDTWILKNKFYGEWQIDVAVVRLVPREKYATIKLLPNIIM